MNETPSIYKPHQPPRKIGDPLPIREFAVSGDSIAVISHPSLIKATADIFDARTNTVNEISVYCLESLCADHWQHDAEDAITRRISPLGYELKAIKYLAEVTVDINTKSLFEAVPEEERLVYKDELN